MNKHTPGPWEVVGSRICTVANDKERITLAKTEPGGAFAMSEQQEANANLIAAAPAMYEALVRLAEKVRRANSIQHSGGKLLAEDWAELYQITNESFGVIAQAEGRHHE